MTFDLKRLAFVTVSEHEAKRCKDIPENVKFAFNAFAHFFQQQLRLGNLPEGTFEAVCRAYHDVNDRNDSSEPYGAKYREEFREEILRYNPKTLETQLRSTFVKLWKDQFKFAEQNDDQRLFDVFDTLGINLEYWGLVEGEVVGQLAMDPKLGIKVPKPRVGAPTLKLLIKPRVARDAVTGATIARDKESYGFEYGIEGSSYDRTLAVVRTHNSAFPEEERVFAAIAGSHGSLSSSAKSSNPAQRGAASASTQPHAQPAPEKPGIPNISLDATTPLGAIGNFLKSFGENLSKDAEKSNENNILSYILGFLFQGVAVFFGLFNHFTQSAQKAYEEANPGRPLGPKEIQDSKDRMFDKFVRTLPASFERKREELNKAWRSAKKASDPVAGENERQKVLKDLKQALLSSGNMQAYDAFRKEKYLEKIKIPAAKAYFSSQNWEDSHAWQNLQRHLQKEKFFIEADDILQELEVEKLEEMLGKEIYRGSGVVEAYQNAINELNQYSETLSKRSEDSQRRHCQVREGILRTINRMEFHLKKCEKDIAVHNQEIAQLEVEVRALNKQKEERLKNIENLAKERPDAVVDVSSGEGADSKVVAELKAKIESEYKAKLEAITQKIKQHEEDVVDLKHAAVDLKSNLVDALSGDLDLFKAALSETSEVDLSDDEDTDEYGDELEVEAMAADNAGAEHLSHSRNKAEVDSSKHSSKRGVHPLYDLLSSASNSHSHTGHKHNVKRRHSFSN